MTVATVIGIGGAAAVGISTLIFIPQFHVVTEVISQQSSFGILPADGILFGLTIGLVVACFNTAWPTYALAHSWLVLTGGHRSGWKGSLTSCIMPRSCAGRAHT